MHTANLIHTYHVWCGYILLILFHSEYTDPFQCRFRRELSIWDSIADSCGINTPTIPDPVEDASPQEIFENSLGIFIDQQNAWISRAEVLQIVISGATGNNEMSNEG